MLETLGPAIESHLMRAVLISGVVALVLTAVVALIWWRGRRWAKARSGSPSPAAHHVAAFSGTAGPASGRGDHEPEKDRPSGADQLASRLIRDAAVRAAGLRDVWDRSYREARDPREPESPAPDADQSSLLQDVLREQRETNALLRELLAGLRQPPD